LEGNKENEFWGRSDLVGVGVQREKANFHGRSGFYPRDEVRAADEDTRRGPASRQLRGQACGGAERSSSAPAACSASPPLRAL